MIERVIVALTPGLLDWRGAAIAAGLVIGKPFGLFTASLLAVRLGLAVKPAENDWLQVAGAGCLPGSASPCRCSSLGRHLLSPPISTLRKWRSLPPPSVGNSRRRTVVVGGKSGAGSVRMEEKERDLMFRYRRALIDDRR